MKRIDKILITAIFSVLCLWGICWAADSELVDLTAADSAAADDVFYLVNDPNGTPADFYIGWDELMLSITKTGTVAAGTWGASFSNDIVKDAAIDWGSGANQVDLADIPGGVSGASAWDFGGATSVELPNGTDPDVDAMGKVAVDSDGANEPNDVIMRVTDTGGDTQYALAMVLKSIQATIISPQDLDDTTRDACPIWENNTGMTFTITCIRAWSDTDDTTLNVETYDSDWDNNATVDALEIATDGTANYYVEETTITAATIAAGSWIVLDFDDTDDPGWVHINVMGYFDADVD